MPASLLICFSFSCCGSTPVGRRGDSRIVRFVGSWFVDRDFPTAPSITSFSFSEKEKEGKRKTAQGTAPRSEPRFAPADRDEIKSRGSMRLRPPRPPGNGQAGGDKRQRRGAHRKKFPYSGQKPFVSCPRGTTRLSLPFEGKPKKVFAAERLIT